MGKELVILTRDNILPFKANLPLPNPVMHGTN